MIYTKVFTQDWYGKKGMYEILNLKKKGDKVSCTFRNSEGNIEEQSVFESQLQID